MFSDELPYTNRLRCPLCNKECTREGTVYTHISVCDGKPDADNLLVPFYPYTHSHKNSHLAFLSVGECFDILINPEPIIRMIQLLYLDPNKYWCHTIQVLNSLKTIFRYYDTDKQQWVKCTNNEQVSDDNDIPMIDVFNELLNTSSSDLKNILMRYESILNNETSTCIMRIIRDCEDTNDSSRRFRGRIIRTLKQLFYDNKEMLVDSMKYVDKCVMINNNLLKKYEDFTKPNVTITDFVQCISKIHNGSVKNDSIEPTIHNEILANSKAKSKSKSFDIQNKNKHDSNKKDLINVSIDNTIDDTIDDSIDDSIDDCVHKTISSELVEEEIVFEQKICKKETKQPINKPIKISNKPKIESSEEKEIDFSKSPRHKQKICKTETIEEKKSNKRKNLPTNIRIKVAGEQHYKCNNTPGSKLSGLERYKCPLWKLTDGTRGTFDAAGFDIDHIIEVSRDGSDERDNLQALCPHCHAYKTRYFRSK